MEYRLHPIMHLLLFLSPDWLTFYHVIISHINSLSDEGHRPFYISICISTLPTQHTTFISVIIYIYIYEISYEISDEISLKIAFERET